MGNPWESSGSQTVLFGTEEDWGKLGRVLGREPVSRFGKVEHALDVVDSVTDEKGTHQAPGLFCIEADNFEMSVFLVLEYGSEYLAL